MKTFILWHGGSSYAVGGYEDIEVFDTLQDAKDAFRSRADFDPYYPCVSQDEPEGGGPEAWLWFKRKPEDDGDLYPEVLLQFGPRGGLITRRC